MKTQLKKMIIGAAALLFVMTGVSFAHESGVRNHKPYGKAHGYYKEKKNHHNRDHRQYKARKHYRKKHAHKNSHQRHYDKKYHAKYNRSHDDRYRYRKNRHHHRDSHHRRSPREDLTYKAFFKDPGMVIKVILNQK